MLPFHHPSCCFYLLAMLCPSPGYLSAVTPFPVTGQPLLSSMACWFLYPPAMIVHIALAASLPISGVVPAAEVAGLTASSTCHGRLHLQFSPRPCEKDPYHGFDSLVSPVATHSIDSSVSPVNYSGVLGTVLFPDQYCCPVIIQVFVVSSTTSTTSGWFNPLDSTVCRQNWYPLKTSALYVLNSCNDYTLPSENYSTEPAPSSFLIGN